MLARRVTGRLRSFHACAPEQLHSILQRMSQQPTPGRLVDQILIVRGQRVLLDTTLAALYEVSTSAFNQAVRRNRVRFPEDFLFELHAREWEELHARIEGQAMTIDFRGSRAYLRPVLNHTYFYYSYSPLTVEAGD